MNKSKVSKSIDWQALLDRLEASQSTLDAQLDPRQAARILRQRAARLARGSRSDDQLDENDSLEVLMFSVGEERFAIETRFIQMVAPFLSFTPIPGVPDYFHGITKLGGAVLALVDPRRLFDLPVRGLSDLHRILVLGRTRPEFGLLVGATESVSMVSQLAAAPQVREIDRACLRGVTKDAVSVLNGEALLKDPRLFIDQSDTLPDDKIFASPTRRASGNTAGRAPGHSPHGGTRE